MQRFSEITARPISLIRRSRRKGTTARPKFPGTEAISPQLKRL
jgi:hypothetical protein